MTDDDVASVARRFFQLWQEQCAAVARDPEVIASMFQVFTHLQEQYLDSLKASTYNQNTTEGFVDKPVSYGKNSPSATSDVSGYGNVPGGELLTRLVACEERLAVLEQKLAGRSRSTRSTAKKNSH